MPNVAFSNRSVIQQCRGATPLRIMTPAISMPIARNEWSATGPSAAMIAHPAASSPIESSMCRRNTRVERPRARNSSHGGTACRSQQRNHAPRLAATEHRQQQRQRHQGPSERNTSDLGAQASPA